MKRRSFLQVSGTGALIVATGGLQVMGHSPDKLKQIGINLFSLPKMLEKDFTGTIAMLAGMGYREVELFGPYPFSAETAKQFWNSVTPSLGFSGSGYFGHSAAEVKAILHDNKIKATAAHTDLDTLENHMERLGEAADQLGFDYVVLPSIPQNRRQSLDDYRRMADSFNGIGESARKNGVRFAYHNHGYGLQETDGVIPFELIADNTDSSLVFFEMDLYWTTAGGVDPVDYLEKYSGRYKMMHVKDMKEKVTFSGDGGTPDQWIALFPYMTSAGSGVLDLENIIEVARKQGLEHIYVEQDTVSNPETALKQSIDYLKTLVF